MSTCENFVYELQFHLRHPFVGSKGRMVDVLNGSVKRTGKNARNELQGAL